jgi:hypothetical protein
MAAVLSCGSRAVLSHESAAALWEIRTERRRVIEVSVPLGVVRRRTGIAVHRRTALTGRDVVRRHGIPVTTPIRTLVDVVGRLGTRQREAAIKKPTS